MNPSVGEGRKHFHALASLGVALVLLFVARLPAAAQIAQPCNRVAIIVDASGSFREQLGKALEEVRHLFDLMGKTRIRRWENPCDRITLISLDAVPEAIWEGSFRDLKAMDQAEWLARFHARTEFAGCTDVGTAFQLAARALAGDPRQYRKYAFIFSDLVNEPPTETLNRCQVRRWPSPPPSSFPWEAFGEVSTAAFWVPPDQKLAWRRAIDAHGLTTFALYSLAESSNVRIMPPPRPEVTLSDAERAAARTWVRHVGGAVLLGFAGAGIFVALLITALWFALRSRRRKAALAWRRPLLGQPATVDPGAPRHGGLHRESSPHPGAGRRES